MDVQHLTVPEINPDYHVRWSREGCSLFEVDKLPIPSNNAVRTLWNEMESVGIGCSSIELTRFDGVFPNGQSKLHLQPRAVRYWLDVHNLVGESPHALLENYKAGAQWLWNQLSYKDEVLCDRCQTEQK